MSSDKSHRPKDFLDAWQRGQCYGLSRAWSEAKVAGHDALARTLWRMMTDDVHARPDGVPEGDWDLDAPTSSPETATTEPATWTESLDATWDNAIEACVALVEGPYFDDEELTKRMRALRRRERASGPGTIDPAAQTLVDRLVEENRPKGGERTKLPISDNASPAYVATHYHIDGRDHCPYQYVLHHPDTDESVDKGGVLRQAMIAAGVEDGDEVVIRVERTGRRPFGKRRFVYVEPHTYQREPAEHDASDTGGAK